MLCHNSGNSGIITTCSLVFAALLCTSSCAGMAVADLTIDWRNAFKAEMLMREIQEFKQLTIYHSIHSLRNGWNPQAQLNKADADKLLLLCAHFGFMPGVRLAMACGADVNVKDEMSRSPLHWAASKSHTDIIKLLLKAGANVNARNEGNATPLHWAAKWGSTYTVKLLLKARANINARDCARQTPLYWAEEEGREDIIKLLREVIPQCPCSIQ